MNEERKLKRSLYFRKPLKSDNLNDTMKLNRFIGSRKAVFLYITLLDILLVCCFNYVYNVASIIPVRLKKAFGDGTIDIKKLEEDSIFSLKNFSFKEGIFNSSTATALYIIFFLFLVIFSIVTVYKMRVSYSESDINKGIHGTQRWTTIEEIIEQYKRVDLRPCHTVYIKLTAYEKNILLGYKKEWSDGESINIKKGNNEYSLLEPKVIYNNENVIVEGIKADSKGIPTHKIIKPVNWFYGSGGTPVSRWQDNLFIDNTVVNNLINGTTRSGKGEMVVHESIDISSRSKEIENRAALILFDPKLELYKSWKKRLEERGYLVRLINIDNPVKSAGYNPLFVVTKHYKAGNYEKAQQQAKTYAFGIFNADINQEAIWKNTSTDLFTALIIAQVSDCIELDEVLNYNRRITLKEKKKQWEKLSPKLREEAYRRWEYVKEITKDGEDLILNPMVSCIPPDEKYFDIFPNERNINCFSVINFFKDLCDRAALSTGNDIKAFEKKAETLLDDYFNARPKLDFASSLYASIKSAGDRTKGSIYTNMQSALTIFSLNNIAQMTAENDINFDEIGFGEKPVAVFLGIPSEDRSNHFLATTFVSQVYQYLFNKAKAGNGKVKRHVRFILDEFGNMPVIYSFESYITVCLGANMSFDIFLQSYSQLDNLYKDAADTIKENCANHFYIMSVGNDSSEEFSKMLGNKTVVELQRTGTRFGTNKTFMESSKERPLMHPQELNVLREGECCIYRGMKRTDNIRAAILSYPILNEYQDNIGIFDKIKLYFNTKKDRKEKGSMINPDTGKPFTAKQEYRKNLSDFSKYKGTAILYRHEYMSDYVPDANKIDFDDVCTESRTHVDYTNRVNDPQKAAIRLSNYYKRKKYKLKSDKKSIKDIRLYPEFYNKLARLIGDDFMDILGFNEDDEVEKVIKILRNADLDKYGKNFNGDFKSRIIDIITRDKL